MTAERVPLLDLRAPYASIGDEVDAAIRDALKSQGLEPEVQTYVIDQIGAFYRR